jgi:putative acetyltransferase
MIHLIRTDSSNVDFHTLVKLLDEELYSRYGILQAQYEKYNVIDSIGYVVIGYFDLQASACGCFKVYQPDTIEIKRMFVKAEHRGSGIAARVLDELEAWALESRFTKSILETGFKQPDAIKFYTRQGYKKIDNYGQYIGNPNSVCFSKVLKPKTI